MSGLARQRALLLFALLLATGCRTLPAEFRPLPPEDERPAALLRALEERAEARRGLRGRAELAVDSDTAGVHLRGRQVLALARPDRLRVEILGLLGQTEAVLVTDAGRFELFVSGDRSYRSGPLYPGLLWQVARIDLEPREVVSLVLGAPPPQGRLALRRALATDAGEVRIELVAPDGAFGQTLVFDASGRLRRLERRVDGRSVWEAHYGDYAPVAGTPVAHAIALEFGGSATRAELLLRDVELNPALPDAIFRLRAPGAEGG